MSTYTRIPLSGSTHGRGIKVTTAAPVDGTDTTIHTAAAVTTDGVGDIVTLFAANADTVSRYVQIGFGGTTAVDDIIQVDIPANQGLILVVADLILRNSLVVVASAEVTNKITVFGYVNRIS